MQKVNQPLKWYYQNKFTNIWIKLFVMTFMMKIQQYELINIFQPFSQDNKGKQKEC